MEKIILEFPKQFRKGIELAEKVRPVGKFKKILVCGMGGSALAGDVLKMWLELEKIALPINVHRNYKLPFWVDKSYLIIIISYSGNTEESISAFKEALKKKLALAVITSGGKLEKLCIQNKIPIALIPKGFPPRMALGFHFSALAKILINCKMLKNRTKEILSLEKSLNPRILEKKGEKIAERIKGIPIIYASYPMETLAKIWKIKFNEQSKRPAFFNFFPELNHNEMIGIEKTKDIFHLIILKDKDPRMAKRMLLTSEILKIKTDFIEIDGKTVLEKIFSNILLSDWVSFYLAVKEGIDPIPVKIIEDFKERLK